jgi:hypothetical protein
MRRILEFRVYDILKDPENEKFLDQVKKENPNLYSKFLNIVGNKGLEKAKEKYKEYDPIAVEKIEKAEKEKQRLINKEKLEKAKKEYRNLILNKYKDKIDEINNILADDKLNIMIYDIRKDNIISKYLTNTRKSYKNLFNKLLKNINIFNDKIERFFDIDSVSLNRDHSDRFFGRKKNQIIKITRYFNTNEIKYSITSDLYYGFNENFYEKDEKIFGEFKTKRNEKIKKIKNFNLSEK